MPEHLKTPKYIAEFQAIWSSSHYLYFYIISVVKRTIFNFTFRWTIKARVTQKSAIRTWSNSRGEGKLFNMNLLDESGEIRATAFKDEVDKYYDMIEVNKVRD